MSGKRGIAANHTILDKNVWRNATFTNLKQDAQKDLAVLIKQLETDPNKITQSSRHNNGFSDLILALYDLKVGIHAHSAIGVQALPVNLPVIVDIIVEVIA